jgi:hypothetical protein
VGLNVGVLSAEESLQALAGHFFDAIDELAAAVIAPAGVTFGIFVGQYGTLNGEDLRGCEVF